MKTVFAKTGNVTNFVSAMTRLTNCADDSLPRMALIWSAPGYGKTRTALWWIAQNDGIFIRTKKLMDGPWLLEEIVGELGMEPAKRTRDMFRQAVGNLMEKNRAIFIDEIDRYGLHGDIIETLRDLHDTTNTPIIFIGMERADDKFKRHNHLYSRFSEHVQFVGLRHDDVRSMADQMCEVKLTDDAIAYIYKQTQSIRGVKVWLYRSETISRINGLKEVKGEHLAKAVKK